MSTYYKVSPINGRMIKHHLSSNVESLKYTENEIGEARKDERQKVFSEVQDEMVLSELELSVKKDCLSEKLDTSDREKWGEDYKKLNKQATHYFNRGVRYSVEVYTAKLRAKLAEMREVK